MKKNSILVLFSILLSLSSLTGCTKEEETVISNPITIKNESHYLGIDQSETLDIELDPSIKKAGVVFSSSNQDILQVNSYGIVTGVNIGSAFITVKSKANLNYSVDYPFTVLSALSKVVSDAIVNSDDLVINYFNVKDDSIYLSEKHYPSYFYYQTENKVEGIGIGGTEKAVRFIKENNQVSIDLNAFYDLDNGLPYYYLSNFYELATLTNSYFLSYLDVNYLPSSSDDSIPSKDGLSYYLEMGDPSGNTVDGTYNFINALSCNYIAGNTKATKDDYLQPVLTIKSESSFDISLLDQDENVAFKVEISKIGEYQGEEDILNSLSDSSPLDIPDSYSNKDLTNSWSNLKNSVKDGLRAIFDQTSSNKGSMSYLFNNNYMYFEYDNYKYKDDNKNEVIDTDKNERGLLFKETADKKMAYPFYIVKKDSTTVVGYDKNNAFDPSTMEIYVDKDNAIGPIEDSNFTNFATYMMNIENFKKAFDISNYLDFASGDTKLDDKTFFSSDKVFTNASSLFKNPTSTYVTSDLQNIYKALTPSEMIKYYESGYEAKYFVYALNSKGPAKSTFDYKDDAISIINVYSDLTGDLYLDSFISFDELGGGRLENGYDKAILEAIDNIAQ